MNHRQFSKMQLQGSSSLFLCHLNRWMALVCLLWLGLSFLHLSTLADPSNIRPLTRPIVIPDLPANHYRFWLRNHPYAFREYNVICELTPNLDSISNLEQFQRLHLNVSLESKNYLKDLSYGKKVLGQICSSIKLVPDSCWGYESGCQHIYVMPECELSVETSSAKFMHELKSTWFNQADFGYIIKFRRDINKICVYLEERDGSSLECLNGFETCKGRWIMFDFQDLANYESPLSSETKKQGIIKRNQVFGWNCDFQYTRLKAYESQNGLLESWFNELGHYNRSEIEQERVCDETIEDQVFVIKLDSRVNMYDYFSNFINLYATFHIYNRFSQNNRIIIWDKQLPQSKFELMWKAFSNNEVRHIGEFQGKRVCFEKYILTLLPKTIDGLYYNTNLVKGCSKSGLFDAFNKHVLHKLNIRQNYTLHEHLETNNTRLRITFISRSSMRYRNISNEKNLLQAMRRDHPEHLIEEIDYAGMDFYQQLETTSNTDLLVGIHGAVLTHTLLLPDWAGLFEVYDCKDSRYSDLARLRGATYFTLPSHAVTKRRVEEPDESKRLKEMKLLDDEKYLNFRIAEAEFLKTLGEAISKVKENRLRHFEKSQNSQLEQPESPKVKLTTQKPQLKQPGSPKVELTTQKPQIKQPELPKVKLTTQKPQLKQPGSLKVELTTQKPQLKQPGSLKGKIKTSTPELKRTEL